MSALTDVLWQAHIGPVAVLALAATEAGVPPSSVGYDQLMRSVVTVSASSKLELEVRRAGGSCNDTNMG